MIKEWNCGAVSLIVLTAGVVLTGCSAVHLPTPYQPYTKPNGGYTDKQIGDDVYRVVFAGTGATPLPTAYAYAVYRAAEIARDHDAPTLKWWKVSRTVSQRMMVRNLGASSPRIYRPTL